MKERLVGAAVLVAIGAWLIPWVLDGPEQLEAPQSTALELPAPTAEDPPIRSETIVLERRDSPMPRDAGAPVQPEPEPEAAPAPAEPPPAAASAPPPAPTPPSEATESAPAEPAGDDASATRWYVQLGAFGDQANADRLATRVETYGYDAQVSGFPSSGRTVHRVRVGPEPTRARAEAIASALSTHGFVAQVVFE